MSCSGKIKDDEQCEICCEGYYYENVHKKPMPLNPFTPLYVSRLPDHQTLSFSCEHGNFFVRQNDGQPIIKRIKKLNFIFGV